MIDLDALQDQLSAWVKHNFGGGDATKPILGAMEELGELCHAHLKQQQGIRGTSTEHEAAARDAVGDIVIYLIDYCNERGWRMADILAETSAEVLVRDWKLYPSTGKPPEVVVTP